MSQVLLRSAFPRHLIKPFISSPKSTDDFFIRSMLTSLDPTRVIKSTSGKLASHRIILIQQYVHINIP
jgi:hypothetical protein